MRRMTLTLLPALCLAALIACAPSEGMQTETPPAASPTEPAPPSATAPSDSPSAEPTPDETPTPEPSELPEPYRFGQPVDESEPVDESWFEDAVFLGDSRTEGFQLYSGLRAGDFFWHKGMTVFKADDPEKRVIEVDGEKLTMMEALARKQYAKVYIMIGINELGYPASSYEKGLKAMVDRVKELQPDAVVYLQTLPPVNEKVAAEKKLGRYINNTNVNAFNEVVFRVAWEKQVALLDVASVYRTEAGDLAADMAVDGVHFYRQGYARWYEYLRSHTLEPERYAVGEPLDEPIVPEVPTPAPSPEPAPSDSPEPSVPASAETPDPGVSSEPEPTDLPEPDPSGSPEPAPTDAPAEDPAPSETPASTETPAAP